MYQTPYFTAVWLALISMLGIIGQMVFAGLAAHVSLALAVAPTAFGLVAYMRRRRS